MSKLNWVMRACGVFLLWAVAAVAVSAQTFTTLHSFDITDGYYPYAGLVQGTDGNFYGTTYFGGANSAGTVFRISPSGTLTTIYNFCSDFQDNICLDGANPDAGLLLAPNGDLYGTTYGGGIHYGLGTVFRITPSGTLTILHSFCSIMQQGNCVDGANPSAALILGSNGQLYGTTRFGGNIDVGTLFTITTSGALTTLYSFCQDINNGFCPDGAQPAAALVQAANGDFYGTTFGGGTYNASCEYGCGTVFKITPTGTLTTTYTFCAQTNCTDGTSPYTTLARSTNGGFYGTTSIGGGSGACPDGCGTVFEITAAGTLVTLVRFELTNGAYPAAGLIQGTDGDLYGTTEDGTQGFSGGTIFKISSVGELTTLYSFEDADGGDPRAGLVQGTDGSFYGTTTGGGSRVYGTVFGLSVGLKPFVETQPTSGAVGALVKILGTDLTGATSVTFNGTAAVFTVDSHSLITTTVPAGATSGKVEVTNATNTIKSNVVFTVRP